jgi:hypothetical protein
MLTNTMMEKFCLIYIFLIQKNQCYNLWEISWRVRI